MKYKTIKQTIYHNVGDIFEANSRGRWSKGDKHYTATQIKDMLKSGYFEEVEPKPLATWPVPKLGQRYWYVDLANNVNVYVWYNGYVDNGLLKAHNVYLTEREAQIQVAKNKAIIKINDCILALQGWWHRDEYKSGDYYWYFYKFNNGVAVDNQRPTEYETNIFKIKSEEIAQKVLEQCKNELEMVINPKYQFKF